MALPVAGIRLGVAQAGIKKPNKDDLTVIEIAEGATVAAVYTPECVLRRTRTHCPGPLVSECAHGAFLADQYRQCERGYW